MKINEQVKVNAKNLNDKMKSFENANYNSEVVKLNNIFDPFFSVIIPVYNVEKYLKECIDSVLNQTFKNYEILLINDGSTDESFEIAKKYATNDNRISLYTHPNMGLSFSRNVGINYANGEYVYFLDSDDFIEENFLSDIYNIISSYKNEFIDVIHFNLKLLYENGDLKEKKNELINYLKKEITKPGLYASGRKYFIALDNNKEFFAPSVAYVLRREFILKKNIYFENGILHEDELFTFQIFLKSDYVVYIDRYYYNYRIRENSIVTTNRNYISTYSTFIIGLRMIRCIKEVSLNEEEIYVFEKSIKRLLNITRNRYISLSEEDKLVFQYIDNDLKILFQILIIDKIVENNRYLYWYHQDEKNQTDLKEKDNEIKKKIEEIKEYKNTINDKDIKIKEQNKILKLKLVKYGYKVHQVLKKLNF
ncbi:MAG: glycosyltransferase [Lachnospiraceae bacterium]|jgi:glycosyltransferase involved in cell wall biosynthesis|nr:glycosyltransferase [Lachnospiraceae bacterium]